MSVSDDRHIEGLWDEPMDIGLKETDERTVFDVAPLRRCLEYVVNEARKHKAAGHDDHFVQVGRVAQATLTWQRLDEIGNFEEAETWLRRIP